MTTSEDSPLLPVGYRRRSGQRRVVPRDPSPERTLERLPKDDLRVLAYALHVGGLACLGKDALIRALAHLLRDPDAVGPLLAEVGDPTAYIFIAELVLRRRIRFEDLVPSVRDDLTLASGLSCEERGGCFRLHALGLFGVGRWEKGFAVYLPEDLRLSYAVAVLGIVPSAIDEAVRQALVEIVESTPPPVAPWAPGLPTGRARRRLPTPGPDRVVELQVSLQELGEPVWRRILVSYQRSLGALHEIIRIAFAWPQRAPHWFIDSRARRFAPRGRRIGDDPSEDEWKVPVRELFATRGARALYVIDRPTLFPHEIRMRAVHAPEHVQGEPFVLEARGVRPPPEIFRPAYGELVAAWRQGDRHGALSMIAGPGFDPDAPPDLDAVNRRLARMR